MRCEQTGEPHEWVRDVSEDGDPEDVCLHCDVRWVDAVRGFASNTRPKRQGKVPTSARP